MDTSLQNKIDQARKAGYSDDEINAFLEKKGVSSSPKEQGVNKVLRNVGLGGVVDVGKTVGGTGEAALGGGAYLLGKLLGNVNLQKGGSQLYSKGSSMASEGQSRFGFAPPETPGNQFNPGQYAIQSAKDAAGLVPFFLPATKGAPLLNQVLTGATRGGLNRFAQDEATTKSVLGGAVGGAVTEPLINTAIGVGEKVSKPIKAMVKNPLPGGAAKNLYKGAETATQRGEQIGWDSGENNLVDQITNEVKKKLTWNKEVKESTNNLLANLTPVPKTSVNEAGLPQIAETAFSPNELLKTRGQVTQTIGQKIFNAMSGKGSPVDDKVYAIARGVITKNLHKLAPETLPPDIALSLYNKLGILGKFGLPGIAGEAILGKKIAGGAVKLLQTLGMGGQ